MASLGSFKKGIVYTKGGLGQTGISTSTGAAPAPTFQFGNALSFDGVNDDVSFTTVNKPALTAGLSISMWVKFYATPDFEYLLGYSGSANMYFSFQSPTVVRFQSRQSGAGITTFSIPAISTGTWYHIAFSSVDTVNELWINGTKYTGNTNTYTNSEVNFDTIGKRNATSYGQLVIDELALQSGAGLTQQDVDDLYNGGLGADATSVMTPDLYYKFDESEPSATTTDYSGNGNTGTVTGATFVPHTPTYDADAEAYFIAAEIPNATEQIAANQLVLDLKGTGSTTNNTDVWGSSYAIYPLSPTSLTAAKYNLKDTTQNITWNNSPTHAYTGITGNGTDAYGLTGYNPVSLGWDKSNAGLTYSGEFSGGDYPLGSLQNPKFFGIRTDLGFKYSYVGSSSTGALAATTARNVATASRTSTTSNKMFINGVEIAENINSELNDLPNVNIMVLALANGASPFAAFAGEIDFAALHTGLTNNQAKDLSDAITTYNTAVRTDPDATAYITAAGITDPTEQAAVIQLVSDLKGTGSTTNNTDVWSDSDRIYPISPTSLTAAKYNLKDPTKNITWYNTPTHATTGVAGNLLDTYGDTGFIPSVDGDINSMAITVSTATVNTINTGVAMGVYSTSPLRFVQMNLTYPAAVIGNNSDNLTGLKNTKSISTLTRDATTMNLYENNVLTDSDISLSASTLPVNPIFVLARGSVK
jgi:hypothetical protein